MIDPISGGAAATALNTLQLVAPSSAPAAKNMSDAASPAAGAKAATRVYVERNENGVYVYRLVDAATGRLLAELPRTDSGLVKVLDDYAPGAVATASA